MELDTLEKTLLAFEPTMRIVPTTTTRITASITAYSAMSWPCSSVHNLRKRLSIIPPDKLQSRIAPIMTAERRAVK
jgi:hypothetical protein